MKEELRGCEKGLLNQLNEGKKQMLLIRYTRMPIYVGVIWKNPVFQYFVSSTLRLFTLDY